MKKSILLILCCAICMADYCDFDKYDQKVIEEGTSIELYEGWAQYEGQNFGLRMLSDSMNSISPWEFLGPNSTYGCANKTTGVWAYIDGQWKFTVWSGLPMLNQIDAMIPGQYYIIKMNGSCTLQAPAGVTFENVEYCRYGCDEGKCLLDIREPFCAEIGNWNYSLTPWGYSIQLDEGRIGDAGNAGIIYHSTINNIVDIDDLYGPNSTNGCGGAIDHVWYYDYTNDLWQRQGWNNNPFPWLNDLDEIVEGKPYSLIINRSCTLTHPDEGMFWKSTICESTCSDGICYECPKLSEMIQSMQQWRQGSIDVTQVMNMIQEWKKCFRKSQQS